jgi:glycosyltransferase involved in cell wall biosynthesis
MAACLLQALCSGAARRGAVIHIGDGPLPLLLLSIVFLRCTGIATILGEISEATPLRFSDRIRRFLVRAASRTGRFRVVCETDAVANSWRCVGADSVAVIPYGVEMRDSDVDQPTARARLSLPSDRPILLLFGVHRSDKDYATVVRAVTLMDPAPVLLFAGKTVDPSHDPAAICRQLGYQDAVVVDCFISREDVQLYFRAANAVILPYPPDFCRGSGVILEACSYECPALVTAGGYLEEFVGVNQVGITYEAGSPNSLRSGIESILSDSVNQTIRSRMKAVASQHSTEVVGALYREVFARSAASRGVAGQI